MKMNTRVKVAAVSFGLAGILASLALWGCEDKEEDSASPETVTEEAQDEESETEEAPEEVEETEDQE